MNAEEMLEQLDAENTQEIVRLVEWLQSHGHSDAEVLDCIRYIGK